MTNQPESTQHQIPYSQLSPEEKKKRMKWALSILSEQARLSKNPLTRKQMLQMRYMMNEDWEKAEQMDGPARQEAMLKLLFERFHFLNNHFLAWEEERANDRRWKENIESQLDSFMTEATKLLRTVSEQAREIIDGNPESQGEMMGLIMGTLNELRGKVSSLENIVCTSKASARAGKN